MRIIWKHFFTQTESSTLLSLLIKTHPECVNYVKQNWNYVICFVNGGVTFIILIRYSITRI